MLAAQGKEVYRKEILFKGSARIISPQKRFKITCAPEHCGEDPTTYTIITKKEKQE